MNEEYSTKQHTAKERYEKLKEKREQYLDRARECSELTIPSLIPDEGFTNSSDLYNPFQSVGARGVNNLASKLLLLLLPPNAPFFRLQVSGDAKKEMEQQLIPRKSMKPRSESIHQKNGRGRRPTFFSSWPPTYPKTCLEKRGPEGRSHHHHHHPHAI